jgi:hypothetical protein
MVPIDVEALRANHVFCVIGRRIRQLFRVSARSSPRLGKCARSNNPCALETATLQEAHTSIPDNEKIRVAGEDHAQQEVVVGISRLHTIRQGRQLVQHDRAIEIIDHGANAMVG